MKDPLPTSSLLRMRLHHASGSAAAMMVLSFGIAAGGCRSKAKSEDASSSSASASAAPSAEAGSAGVATELMTELRSLGETCQIEPPEDKLRCSGGAHWRLSASFSSDERDRASALPTLVQALSDPHPGVRGLSAHLLRSAFGATWAQGGAAGKVEPSAARALMDAAFKQPPATAKQLVPAVVNAMTLAGQTEPLLGELAKPEHTELRVAAYPFLMARGRLTTFPTVKQAVQQQDLPLALAALEAPANMSRWTVAEQQAICEWGEKLLSDERPEVAAKVALVLGHCTGDVLDRMLERAAQQLRAGKLELLTLRPLHDMCIRLRESQTQRGSTQQCDRARELLRSAVEKTELAADVRAGALNYIVELWPDAASASFAKRFEKDPHEQVSKAAQGAAESFSLALDQKTVPKTSK